MRSRFLLAAATLTFVATGGARPTRAQGTPQPALTRTILLTRPMPTVPGHEGTMAVAVLAVGGTAPRHTHPGEEFAYVLEGTATFEVAGQPTVSLKPGDAFLIPANTPHVARNTGAVPLKLISTYIIETGKPLATPAPLPQSPPPQ